MGHSMDIKARVIRVFFRKMQLYHLRALLIIVLNYGRITLEVEDLRLIFFRMFAYSTPRSCCLLCGYFKGQPIYSCGGFELCILYHAGMEKKIHIYSHPVVPIRTFDGFENDIKHAKFDGENGLVFHGDGKHLKIWFLPTAFCL